MEPAAHWSPIRRMQRALATIVESTTVLLTQSEYAPVPGDEDYVDPDSEDFSLGFANMPQSDLSRVAASDFSTPSLLSLILCASVPHFRQLRLQLSNFDWEVHNFRQLRLQIPPLVWDFLLLCWGFRR
jgi:hypothetical protein